MISCSSVILRAQAGESEAFNRLVLLHERDLCRFVRRKIPRREDAADLCQDVLVRAYLKLSQFDGRSSFLTWLLSIAKRAVADFYRADHALRFDNLDPADLAQDCHNLANPQAQCNSVAEVCEVRQQIWHCLACLGNHLSPEEHVATILCDIYGFSDREASRIMTKNLGTFKHLLHRARTRMDQASPKTCALVRKTGDATSCEGLDRLGPDPPEPSRTGAAILAPGAGTEVLLSLRRRLMSEIESFIQGSLPVANPSNVDRRRRVRGPPIVIGGSNRASKRKKQTNNREFIMPERMPEVLRWRPWPTPDPVAPWIIDRLNEVQLARLAAVELELNKAVLEAQLKATAQLGEIVKGMAKQ